MKRSGNHLACAILRKIKALYWTYCLTVHGYTLSFFPLELRNTTFTQILPDGQHKSIQTEGMLHCLRFLSAIYQSENKQEAIECSQLWTPQCSVHNLNRLLHVYQLAVGQLETRMLYWSRCTGRYISPHSFIVHQMNTSLILQ